MYVPFSLPLYPSISVYLYLFAFLMSVSVGIGYLAGWGWLDRIPGYSSFRLGVAFLTGLRLDGTPFPRHPGRCGLAGWETRRCTYVVNGSSRLGTLGDGMVENIVANNGSLGGKCGVCGLLCVVDLCWDFFGYIVVALGGTSTMVDGDGYDGY